MNRFIAIIFAIMFAATGLMYAIAEAPTDSPVASVTATTLPAFTYAELTEQFEKVVAELTNFIIPLEPGTYITTEADAGKWFIQAKSPVTPAEWTLYDVNGNPIAFHTMKSMPVIEIESGMTFICWTDLYWVPYVLSPAYTFPTLSPSM